MSNTAKGTFSVKLQPLPFEGQSTDSSLGRMSIDKQIAGDLVATTRGQMLSARGGMDGSAGYVAMEHVDGQLDDRSGTFVLQHSAVMDRGKPHMDIRVVPDSGTGELTGLSGTFEIRIDSGQHFYTFTYSLEGART